MTYRWTAADRWLFWSVVCAAAYWLGGAVPLTAVIGGMR
jgi:hypothetical protein